MLYVEDIPALQDSGRSHDRDRTAGGARGNCGRQVSIGDYLELRDGAVERDFARAGQVIAENRNRGARFAGEQRHVYERCQAHIEAVHRAVIARATELGGAIEEAVGGLNRRSHRGRLRQVGVVVKAVEAGVGSSGRRIEEGTVAAGSAVRCGTVIVVVGGPQQASAWEGAVAEGCAEAVKNSDGEAGSYLINGSLADSAAILRSAIEVAIRSLDQRADGKGAARAAREAIGVVDDSGSGHLNDGSTEICSALRDRDVEESVRALRWWGNGRVAVNYVEAINYRQDAGTGQLVDDAVSAAAAAACGAVEITVGGENGRTPRERAVDKGVEVVKNGERAGGCDLEKRPHALGTTLLRGAIEIAVVAESESPGGIRGVGGGVCEAVDQFLRACNGHVKDRAKKVFATVVGGAVEVSVGALNQGDVIRVGSAGAVVGEIVDSGDRLGLGEGGRAERSRGGQEGDSTDGFQRCTRRLAMQA